MLARHSPRTSTTDRRALRTHIRSLTATISTPSPRMWATDTSTRRAHLLSWRVSILPLRSKPWIMQARRAPKSYSHPSSFIHPFRRDVEVRATAVSVCTAQASVQTPTIMNATLQPLSLRQILHRQKATKPCRWLQTLPLPPLKHHPRQPLHVALVFHPMPTSSPEDTQLLSGLELILIWTARKMRQTPQRQRRVLAILIKWWIMTPCTLDGGPPSDAP